MRQENPRQDQKHAEPLSRPSLRQVIELVSSLITLSYVIKPFSGKWQLIRNKLEELNSSLTAIENCETTQNPILSGIISAISVSANHCHDLAKRCVDLSYGGKLLMQSDLDVIASKFDRHVKNLSGVCSAGVLTHDFAIIVSKPGADACRDDMRFYVRDLFTRLKIGDSEMKRQAFVKLHEVIVEDDKYVKILVTEVSEIVNLLVNFLDSYEIEIQEEAAKVVAVISGFDCNKSVLVGAGIIGPLVRVLDSGSELGQVSAARSLQKLTQNSDNAWSVSAHGGVDSLLEICASCDSSGELICPACGVSRNLIGVSEIKRYMVEYGAIWTFLFLSRSKDEAVQINAIEFVQNIVSGDEEVRELVVTEGGIGALVRVLEPNVSSTAKAKETALRAIEALCFSSPSSINILLSYGFMDQLLFLLRTGDVSVQELALKTAFTLSSTSNEIKKSMGEAGFMHELVEFLYSKSFEVRELSLEALSGMLLIPKNRRKFVRDEINISLFLQFLEQENQETISGNSKKFLISILISLTTCNRGRKRIVSSNCLKNIEELADCEASDAKELIKKLSANRFRNMFNGIWRSGL